MLPVHYKTNAVPSFLAHPKRKGEWSESVFLTRVTPLGFYACQPWGDSAPFDWALLKISTCHPERGAFSFAERRIWGRRALAPKARETRTSGALPRLGALALRVQVKSAFTRSGSKYAFRTTGNTREHPTYSSHEIDFLACYIVDLDLWYIIPISAIAPGQSFVYLYPDGGSFDRDKRGRRRVGRQSRNYEQFREAWHLLG